MPGTTLVVAGGPETGPVPAAFSTYDRCIAADSGADFCRAHGLAVDRIVGDLDSISTETLAWFQGQGVSIERYPASKDQTDLELALDAATGDAPDRLLVMGIGGGRLDHFLANIPVLASAAAPGRPVEAVTGSAHLTAFVDCVTLVGAVGETVSLLALLGPVEGIVTSGLGYPLRGDSLLPTTARGVSNVFSEPEARIEIGRGTLVVVRPGPEQPGLPS